jgi:hypothetical protein
MNKNNFFARFAFFYIGTFIDFKDYAIEIWDALKELIEPILTIIMKLLLIASRVILLFIPVLQIYVATKAVYLTKKELIELDIDKNEGYFVKKSIDERKKELKQTSN